MEQIRNKVLLKRIAKRIKEIRKQKGITQEQLYFDTNIHIGRIERGETNISVSTLFEICRYLGVTLSEFFEPVG